MTMEIEIVPAGRSLAEARRTEDDAIRSDDPWTRADAQAARWLRSPRLSEGTRDQYARIWASWRTWCEMIDVAPFAARRSDVEAYTAALATVGSPGRPPADRKPLARRTIAQHMAAISSYYRRAIEDELTERNPVPTSSRPRVSRQSRQPHLTPDEIRGLIAAADDHSAQMSALVALLALVCLRVSEALAADIENLAREAGVDVLWVVRKGDKGERVLLPPPASVRVRRAVAGRRSGPIVTTSTGRPVDRKAAWARVRRLGEKAGITAEIGPHTLRHAYITRGHELGIPVADLQDAAGHSSVETTRLYDRRRFDPATHPSFKIASDLVPVQP